MSTKLISRNITQLIKESYQTPAPRLLSPFRTYALSRFPDRNSGNSRQREKPKRVTPRAPPPQDEPAEQGSGWFNFPSNVEGKPSAEESPLWQASQRPPASDPEEGLTRLLMDNNLLIVTRQIEMLNIFVGFEQANKYIISNEQDEVLGYIAEEERNLLSMFYRQAFHTRRPFRALVMDSAGSPILWIRRPFSWINSRMFVQRLNENQRNTSDDEPLLDTFAEVQQQWHLWRRRYNLFLQDAPRRILSAVSDPQPEPEPDESFNQVARVDEGFLAWNFIVKGSRGEELASIDRTFTGFGREMFTDTGRYFVRFGPRPIDPADPTPREPTITRDLSLEERALVLAQAVNIDFDYFSTHSGNGGLGGLGIEL